MKIYQRKDIRLLIEKLVKLIGFKDFLLVIQKSFGEIMQLDNEQIIYQYRQLESLLCLLGYALTQVETQSEGGDTLLEMVMVLLNRNI